MRPTGPSRYKNDLKASHPGLPLLQEKEENLPNHKPEGQIE